MADIPIIFSAPMVRALLREAKEPGTGKSMTRRLAWAPYKAKVGAGAVPENVVIVDDFAQRPSPWQNVKACDRLWVKEAIRFNGEHSNFYYVADDSGVGSVVCRRLIQREKERGNPYKNLGGRYVARFTSRLTLVVTETKVERLHEISRADVLAEGILPADIKRWEEWLDPRDAPGHAFGVLWDSLHGKGAWDQNPEVVALRYRVHLANIDAMKEAA